MKKKKSAWTCILFSIGLTLYGCGFAQESPNIEHVQNTVTVDEQNELLYITEADQDTEFTNPIYVDLSQIEVDYRIEKAGEYVLTGECTQTLVIDAHDEMVHLFFNGVNIETVVGPAVYVESAGKVIITLMDGTENVVLDSAYYDNEELNATIYAECDLTINGKGNLKACGYYKDAIHTKDVFKLLNGQVHLQSKRCGIKGNDGVVLIPDSLVIESEKNGCETTNSNNEEKGIIRIGGGTISIVAGEYALVAVSDIYVEAGNIYFNSVIDDIYTEGQQFIAEGIITNE